jgi:Carboxypeptidase regulatory-like domain
MGKKWLVCLAVLAMVVGLAFTAYAQETAVKGAISGVVLDTTGAAIPGAKVMLSGPTGTNSTMSNASGVFVFSALIPGIYSVRVERQNFKASTVSNLQVLVDQTNSIRVTLEPGAISQTVNVTAASQAVDTTSTAVTSSFNSTFYQLLPLRRSVTSLFYLSPGTKSGLATGPANPSISGGSGLENQYIADGVSLTDTAFGGLGIYNRVYSSLGTGLDLGFIQEVDVKTGGYEPQYGGATGGIVQIVTKSGGRDYHGGISAFWQPRQLEAARLNPDQFGTVNKVGNLVHNDTADLFGELGGYVPGFRNHLFFYAAADPSEVNRIVTAPSTSSLGILGEFNRREVTYNYDFKGTWRINDNHTIESSIFGDPSHTNTAPFFSLRWGPPGQTPDTRIFSSHVYGDRDWAVRYNGTLSPTWVVNADFTWLHNYFTETFNNSAFEIINQTQTAGLPGQAGLFDSGSEGFVENTDGEAFKSDIATSKTFNFWGSHTFTVGASLWRTFYDGLRNRAGGIFPMPTDNAVGDGQSGDCSGSGLPCMFFSGPDFCPQCVSSPTNWEFQLRLAPSSCTLCPVDNVPGLGVVPVYLHEVRAEFGLGPNGKSFATNGTFVSGYFNDSWTINKYVTVNAGLRWQDQRMVGGNISYSFTDNWEPRIGVIIDPKGDRKNKIFANFARYSYAIPLDLAERSLTNELDLFGFNMAPANNGTPVTVGGVTYPGTVTPDAFGSAFAVIDNAHSINSFGNQCFTVDPTTGAQNPTFAANCGVPGFTFGSTESTEAIFPGTKMSLEDEWVIGAEHQFPHGVVLSAKFLRRDLKRIVEDTGGIGPEAALAGITQNFAITNVSSTTDIFVNPIEHKVPADTPVCNNTDPFCGSFTPQGVFVPTTFTGTSLEQIAPSCVIPGSSNSMITPTSAAFYDPAVQDTFGNVLGGACFNPTGANGGVPGAVALHGDGVPDGFPDPIRQYWAVEFEVNKAFSNGWQLRANWTISRLFGNFEGAFRNDNGQSDPSISSLFDFTPGEYNLLGDQFKPGVLNTDRFHEVHAYLTYQFQNGPVKGLILGTGINFETGIPLNDLKAHPVYENAGEVPVGGRGALGRSSPSGTVDFHADYPWRITENQRLHFGVDWFNLANSRRLLFINQNEDLSFGTPNVDFKKPANIFALGDAFVDPMSARIFVRWEF